MSYKVTVELAMTLERLYPVGSQHLSFPEDSDAFLSLHRTYCGSEWEVEAEANEINAAVLLKRIK